MFTTDEKQQLHSWFEQMKRTKNAKNEHSIESEREQWLKKNPCPISEKIETLYSEGYGFKTLSKALDLPLSPFKTIVRYIGFETRKGQSIVTDKLRETRRNNVLGENSPWFDWPNKKPGMLANSKRCIQGYYEKKNGKKVWLRSTYEYVMAKWLDKMGVEWEVEQQAFVLSNGERYRPDFFIYENGNLKSVIETKSRYFNKDNREYKFHLFKEEFNIECSLVTDILLFTDKTYAQELKEWKDRRLLEK